MKANCFICILAQADVCSVDGSFANAKLYVDKQTSFTLTLRVSSGNVCQHGENKINVDLVDTQGSSTKGDIELLSPGQAKIFLTPERRGQHQLNVKVNGANIKNSPFTVTVYMPPHLLSRPVATISGLERPCSLRCSQDKVLATELEKSRIIEINSQYHIHELKQLLGLGEVELTQDVDLNVYVSTGGHHNTLIKLSKTGSVIKIVGKKGKRNAEFICPNGVRVSKKGELYVCDSDNNRVQVFDLNLNFKRTFGKQGTGKGQFNFPADVNFDSSGNNIYITDIRNHRIQVFTCTEHHIRTIAPKNQIFHPVSLLMHDENMYVTDSHNHKVWVMNTSGETIATFGGGHLRYPEGITMDKAGFVYVTSHYSKILVF